MNRNDFEVLKNYVYLDSGATALKPNIILDSIKKYYLEETSNIHINIKIASSLWKNVPNSMYLAAEYKGKTLSASIKNENINNMVETQKMKYISPIITEVRQIFFIFCGSFKYGGRKYKHEIPPNAVMLVIFHFIKFHI